MQKAMTIKIYLWSILKAVGNERIKNADDEFDREEMGRVYGLKLALHLIENLDVSVTQQPEKCGDCISREEAKQFLYERLDRLNDDELYDIFSRIIDDMYNELPSATPKPKIGRWIKTHKAVMGDGYMWYCNKCEHQVYQDSSRPYPSEKFCPNCGAKMEVDDV